ncbi:MAG: glycosyltransferase [Candidatus Moraniibacteriota bacterium]|nr:MAG: glycosyltransferase [Candidatus Moranbacteria bacterium]
MRSKHVDVVEKYCYPVAAGIEVNTVETYSVFVKNDWSVTMHASNDTLTEKHVLPNREIHRGMTIQRYPFTFAGYFPRIRWAQTDAVCLHNFNVVPHFFIMLYTLIRKLLGRKRYALLLTPHGGFNPEWSVFPRWQVLLKRTYHYTIGAWLINRSVDGVRAVSEWERQEMIKCGIRREIISVISNGLEDEAFGDVDMEVSDTMKQTVQSWGRYIIQVGRVYGIKNYETVIRALPNIPSDVKFVIVGPEADVAYRKKLESLSAELGVSGRVIFAGVIRGYDKYYCIKHAEMMVHMAIWESFCNVVHEGLSQGLVCIVADNTALPLLIRNGINGFVLPTKDSVSLGEKITFVLQNKNADEIRNIREYNEKHGRDNSWESVAQKMETWYEEKISRVRSV